MEDSLKISCNWNRIFLGAGLFLVDYFIYKGLNLETVREGGIIMTSLSALFFLLALVGGYLILSGSNKDYKVDRNGITAHEKSARLFTPWEECAYLGIEKEYLVLKNIICIRKKGGYALKLPYSQKLWEGIHEFVPEGIPSGVQGAKNGTVYPQKRPFILKDTEGEMVVDTTMKYREKHKIDSGMMVIIQFIWIFFIVVGSCLEGKPSVLVISCMAAFNIVIKMADHEERMIYGRMFAITKEGVRIMDKRKQSFHAWQEFDEIGVSWERESRYSPKRFYIFCNGKNKKLKGKITMEYTPTRYEQFLTYVPEGALTHPPTQKFELEWLKKWK